MTMINAPTLLSARTRSGYFAHLIENLSVNLEPLGRHLRHEKASLPFGSGFERAAFCEEGRDNKWLNL